MNIFTELQHNASTNIDRHIADYIVNHPNDIAEITLDELADRTYASKSTVLRFFKKNGYSGFNEFKIQLAIEMNMYLREEYSQYATLPFDKNDNLDKIIYKITSQNIYSLLETSSVNSDNKLEEIAEKIIRANHLYFFGIDRSASIIHDAYLHFFRTGIPTTYCSSEMEILTYSQFLKPNDVIFFYSYTGEDAPLVNALKIINHKKTCCVSITRNKKNSIMSQCNYNLYINALDNSENNLYLSSRIATLNLFDIIYALVLSKKSDHFYDSAVDFK